MALDYYLALNMTLNQDPILRFYGWKPYCLSLGYHQNENLVDYDAILKANYQVVRRPTGGSAIFHSEELTYALILPRTQIDHHTIYYLFHKLLANALNELGYPVELNNAADHENYLRESKKHFACFNRPALAEIKYQNKKVVGSAQKLYKNALLQHGSILLGEKQNEIISFLAISNATKKRYLQKLKQSSISLWQIDPTLVEPTIIAEQLLNQLRNTLNLNLLYHIPSQNELQNAQKFVDHFKIK